MTTSKPPEDPLAFLREHKRHFFITTTSGKPIFTLHGDAFNLVTFFAVVSALAALTGDDGPYVEFDAGTHHFLLETAAPFLFMTVTQTCLSTHAVLSFHRFAQRILYSLVPVSAFKRVLAASPSYDLRRMLDPHFGAFRTVLKERHSWLGAMTNRVEISSLPLKRKLNELIHAAVSKDTSLVGEVLMCVVLHGFRVVCITHHKRFNLKPTDLNVIVAYTFDHVGLGLIGLPDFSGEGKLPICVEVENTMKVCVLFKTEGRGADIAEFAKGLGKAVRSWRTFIFSSMPKYRIELVQEKRVLFYFIVFEKYIWYGPINTVLDSKGERRRVFELAATVFHEFLANSKTRRVTEIGVCGDRETVTVVKGPIGTMVCVFNVLVDVPRALELTREIELTVPLEQIQEGFAFLY